MNSASKFSTFKYAHFKYIENVAKYGFDEKNRATVSFAYKIPLGKDYTSTTNGNYSLTRFETTDGLEYLYGTFVPYDRDYDDIRVEIVLFSKASNKILNQNKEFDARLLNVLKDHKTAVPAITGNGADRKNADITSISNKVLLKIDKATGWMKSPDGQWLEGSNKIQNISLSSKDIGDANVGVYKIGQDNFEWIEVRDMVVQGRPLVVIIKKMQSHKDMEIYNKNENSLPTIAFMVFDKNKSIYNKSKNEYTSSLFYWGSIRASENYIKDVIAEINTIAIKFPDLSKSEGTTQNLHFYFTASDNNPDVGRFMLYSSKDLGIEHLFLPVPIPLGTVLSKNPKNSLKDYYFELPTNKIMTLVNLIK